MQPLHFFPFAHAQGFEDLQIMGIMKFLRIRCEAIAKIFRKQLNKLFI